MFHLKSFSTRSFRRVSWRFPTQVEPPKPEDQQTRYGGGGGLIQMVLDKYETIERARREDEAARSQVEVPASPRQEARQFGELPSIARPRPPTLDVTNPAAERERVRLAAEADEQIAMALLAVMLD